MTMEERLMRLEKQNRWMKAGAAVLVVGAAVILLAGAQPHVSSDLHDEIRAKRIVIVNNLYKTVATLEADIDGHGSLVLLDKDSNERFEFMVHEDNSSQLVIEGPRRPGEFPDDISIGINHNGPNVSLADAKVSNLVWLGISKASGPHFLMDDDKRDKPIFQIPKKP